MRWPTRILYLISIPAIAVAAGVLAYFSFQSARQFATQAEQSVLSSTLVLVDEKVDRIEQQIIHYDEAVFHLVDLAHPEEIDTVWLPLAERVSPSVRALLVLSDSGEVLGFACRCGAAEQRDFRKVFIERVLPNLQLEQERVGVLRHHHRTYANTNYLISYRALRHEGRRYYVALHHDTGFIVRDILPTLFVHEEERISFNVVDDDNRIVYGQSRIARAGDYLVARRFPTTLYGWRLQIAPKQAPALIVRDRERVYTESSLIALSLVVVLLGVGFLMYAATKQARLNALRSEFVANVSHELKTPLSVVRMFSEMLVTGRVRDDAKRLEYLQIIARESERLTALIDNVLDFSAIERGKQTYVMRESDLHETVQRTIETFRYRLEKEGVEVQLIQKGKIPPLRFDEQAILLAMMNLLDNAVKHGEGTPVDVTIERGRRHVYVRVRDRGPGIPTEHHKRVFERFYRVRSAGSAIRGSGIGLSLVARIIEAHHGRAWVENAPSGGAIVSFSLPVAEFSGKQTGEDDALVSDARVLGSGESPAKLS